MNNIGVVTDKAIINGEDYPHKYQAYKNPPSLLDIKGGLPEIGQTVTGTVNV